MCLARLKLTKGRVGLMMRVLPCEFPGEASLPRGLMESEAVPRGQSDQGSFCNLRK